MKIAFVHDWFCIDGGAEKVARELITISESFGKVDVFCLFTSLENSELHKLTNNKNVTTSFLQRMPFIKAKYRYYLPLYPFAIEQIDVTEYDLIISSSFSVAKGILTLPHQIHICYCHSPARYAWDQYHFHVNNAFGGFITRNIARMALHYFRNWDVNTANRVDYYISNSHHIAKRIKKIYGKESKVIHPFTEINNTLLIPKEKREHYLVSTRLVPYKRIDLVIDAFNKTPERKLIITGTGPCEKELKTKANRNIEFKGFVEREELTDLYSYAKGFITVAEEDFGITHIESQSFGTPVIAYHLGGAKETIIDNRTGVLFKHQNSNIIKEAIDKLESIYFTEILSVKEIKSNSEKYSKKIFTSKTTDFINSKINEFEN